MHLPSTRSPAHAAGHQPQHRLQPYAAAAVLPAARQPQTEEQAQESVRPAQDAPYRPGDLIYALGTLDYDFGSEAHRDFLVQYLRPTSPFDREGLMAHLAQNPLDAEWLTWIVKVDGVPICALDPSPAYGRVVYAWLRDVFAHPGHEHVPEETDSTHDVEMLVSLPGTIVGRVGLASGQVVPLVDPKVGGLFAWEQGAIERTILQGTKVDKEVHRTILQHVDLFQRNAARELRNVGRAPRERALNFAVTTAFQYTEDLAMSFLRTQEQARSAQQGSPAREELATLRQVWQEKGSLELSHIDVQPSPICRPDSGGNCWDIKLVLFDPAAGATRSGVVYHFTVDISSPLPVVIGEMQQWSTVLLTPRY
jgi:hypothetical protein